MAYMQEYSMQCCPMDLNGDLLLGFPVPELATEDVVIRPFAPLEFVSESISGLVSSSRFPHPSIEPIMPARSTCMPMFN